MVWSELGERQVKQSQVITRRPPDSVSWFVMLIGCLVFLPGCAMFDVGMPSILDFEEDPEFQTPHQLIPVWTDTVLHRTGVSGTRGCGGRFMFYSGEGKEAVRVDGSVVVYVWNDTLDTQQRKPDRKYVFKADELQTHYSSSKVGHSYSFFLPWDKAGGERVELTVVARFVGRDGADVTSTPNRVILPGAVKMPEPPRESKLSEGESESNIQQVSLKSREAVETRHRESLRSSVIPLTAGFVERNQSADGYTAEDLFAEETPAASPLKQAPQTPQPPSDTATTESATNENEEESSNDPWAVNVMEGPSAQRAARLLQSRFQARRARVARRAASHAEIELFPELSPPASPTP